MEECQLNSLILTGKQAPQKWRCQEEQCLALSCSLACIVSWSSSGILAWKESPTSVSHHRQPVCSPRVGQCNVSNFSCLRVPSSSEALLPPSPFPAVPLEGAHAPRCGALLSHVGAGWVTCYRRSAQVPLQTPATPSQAQRRRGGRGGRMRCAPSSLAGALAPNTAVPATSACAASTTTASGSITVWAKGTTGESGPGAHGGLGTSGSDCESWDLETAQRARWGRGCLEKLCAGVHLPCAALRLMLLMAASWDS